MIGQGATGNAYIDGVLSGVKWSGQISFSFPDAASRYPTPYANAEPTIGFAQASLQLREAARSILLGDNVFHGNNVSTYGSFWDVIAPSIVESGGLGNGNAGINSGLGDIRLAESTRPSTAYAYYPSNATDGSGGDVWFGTAYAGTTNDLRNPYLGGYAYHTVIHELGHAMGLKHSQETGGPGNVAVPSDRDAIEFTLMSYRSYVGGPAAGGYTYEQYGAPQTLMMLDIQALQTMYGAYYGTQAGNTVYKWSPTTGEMSLSENGGAFVGQGAPGGGVGGSANRVFLTTWDGNGIDTYDMSNYATDVSISLKPGEWSVTSNVQRAYLGGGNYANGNVYNSLLFNGDTRSLIENALGGVGNDTITGNQAANTLTGNGGNDTMNGDTANDTLLGGAGNDVLDGGQGTDSLVGGDGNDRMIQNFGGPNEIMDGGAGTDTGDWSYSTENWTISLVAGTAVLSSTVFAQLTSLENLIAGSGNDALIGSVGANSLSGGAGNDSLDGGLGNDTLIGGTGTDTATFASSTAAVTVSLSTGTATGQGTDTLSAIENVIGSNYSDRLTGNTLANSLSGGAGNDSLDGGLGNDTLIGGTGTDTATFASSTAAVTVSLSTGTATGQGTDTLSAIENVIGSNYSDRLTGNTLANSLSGGAGNDSLDGGLGNDTLIGGTGVDRMTGGTGSDVFDFNSSTETVITSPDVITDFGHLVDDIDVYGIDASSVLSGNNAFSWRGTGGFGTGAGGELRYAKFDNTGTTNDYTMVYGDRDSDTSSEFRIKLLGLIDLSSSDFRL